MTTRWIVAAAAAVGVGVLMVPMLLGRTPKAESDPVTSIASGSEGATCKASNKATLNYTVKDMNGAQVKISDYAGKVILLNYWATWCGPCRVEIPGFVELYDQYKDKGLVILGVSTDDDPETLRGYAKEMKMNYPVLVGRENDELLDAFGPLFGLPTSYVIGRDGSVCAKQLGPASKEDFEKALKPLL
ncbi:MAG TPA: TlpA disulfide reductase family protein [Vicinamibacterales bacterium]|jgi:peroxiredoxin|nr:TlpA disulfide reductase family protein [Vicinamibacterales bacterium]